MLAHIKKKISQQSFSPASPTWTVRLHCYPCLLRWRIITVPEIRTEPRVQAVEINRPVTTLFLTEDRPSPIVELMSGGAIVQDPFTDRLSNYGIILNVNNPGYCKRSLLLLFGAFTKLMYARLCWKYLLLVKIFKRRENWSAQNS